MTDNTGSNLACQWCGSIHQGACPRVKAIEYYDDGAVKRVEFHAPEQTIRPYEPEDRIFVREKICQGCGRPFLPGRSTRTCDSCLKRVRADTQG